MDLRARPFRSVLYIPASKERALQKARDLAADAIIFDLEDAVAPSEKALARRTLKEALAATNYGRRARIVRINGFDSEWAKDDLDAITGLALEGVLLPKANDADDIAALAAAIPDVPLWAMMETPQGVLNAASIAAQPRMAGFVMGTNDLAKELGCRFRSDRMPLLGSLQTSLLAARAYSLIAIDGVYNAFRDEEGLQRECAHGRDMGFDGKTLIHPAQIELANRLFAPTEDDIALAHRQIAAFEQATARGEGVAVVDGRIVENLHIETAQQTLAKAAAIAAMQGE